MHFKCRYTRTSYRPFNWITKQWRDFGEVSRPSQFSFYPEITGSGLNQPGDHQKQKQCFCQITFGLCQHLGNMQHLRTVSLDCICVSFVSHSFPPLQLVFISVGVKCSSGQLKGQARVHQLFHTPLLIKKKKQNTLRFQFILCCKRGQPTLLRCWLLTFSSFSSWLRFLKQQQLLSIGERMKTYNESTEEDA